MIIIKNEHKKLFLENIPEKYINLVSSLNNMNTVENLPASYGLGIEDNSTYDQQRLELINPCINILKYHINPEQLVPQVLSEKRVLEEIALDNAKEFILNLSRQLTYLSRDIKNKFENLLKTSDFPWKKFEQLASLMISHDEEVQFILPSDQPDNRAIYERVFNEYVESEKITKAAIPSIIKDDIPELEKFITYIQEYQLTGGLQEWTPTINLMASRILINRVFDLNNIIKLTKIVNPEFDNLRDLNDRPAINLGGVAKKYFALRRMQIVGELIVENNLSEEIKLDKTVDWESFKKLRHALIHQERYQNREKTDFIIANPKILEGMLGELHSLNSVCFNNLLLRDGIAPYFRDGGALWNLIYFNRPKVTNDILPLKAEEQESLKNLIKDHAITHEVLESFLKFLNDKNADQKIQQFWKNFSEKKIGSIDKSIINQSLEFIKQELKDQEQSLRSNFVNNIIKPTNKLLSEQNKLYEESKKIIKRKIENEIIAKQLKTPFIMAVNNLFYDGMTSNNFRSDGKIPSLKESIETIIKTCSEIEKIMHEGDRSKFAIEYLVIKSIQILDSILDRINDIRPNLIGEEYERFIKPIRNYIAHGHEIFDVKAAESRANGDDTNYTFEDTFKLPALYIISIKEGVSSLTITNGLHSNHTTQDLRLKNLIDHMYDQLPELNIVKATDIIKIYYPSSYSDAEVRKVVSIDIPSKEIVDDNTYIYIDFKDLLRITYLFNSKNHFQLINSNISIKSFSNGDELAIESQSSNKLEHNSLDISLQGFGGSSLIGNEFPIHRSFTNLNILFSGISIPPAKLFIQFPSFKNTYTNREGDNSVHENSVSSHFIGNVAAQALNPGIICLTDMVNGKNNDNSCYSYYKDTFNSCGYIAVKTALSSVTFGITNYSGLSLVNSVIASKLATDAIESILSGDFSINPQAYASGMLQYIAKMGATTAVSLYFDAKADIPTAILINLAPSLIDLGSSIIYQGAVMVDWVLNPNGEYIDFDYYL